MSCHPLFKYRPWPPDFLGKSRYFRPLRWIDVNARSRIRQMELEREQALIVEVVWECEIKKLLQNTLSMEMFFKQYYQTQQYRKPIDPRDSLYGT